MGRRFRADRRSYNCFDQPFAELDTWTVNDGAISADTITNVADTYNDNDGPPPLMARGDEDSGDDNDECDDCIKRYDDEVLCNRVRGSKDYDVEGRHQILNTMEDNVRECEAMDRMPYDDRKAVIEKRVTSQLRMVVPPR